MALLECQVKVINRTYSSLNISSNDMYLKSILTLEMEPTNEKEYFILHLCTANTHGNKYKIKFMEKSCAYVSCLKEGKVTLRFEEPAHDLCIISEVIQLTKFMRLLKSRVTLDAKDSDFRSFGVTDNDLTPTELVVTDCSEFSTEALPQTLEYLHIVGLNLCNFRSDILLLNNLVVLDLTNNKIENLPAELETMPNIRELHLAHNCLGVGVHWGWLLGRKINQKLQLLDLSGNNVKELPQNIWKLQQLVTLKLDYNKLQKLPATLGRIQSLRYLSVSHNQLRFLPSSLIQCHLKCVDISSNNFIENSEYDEDEDNSETIAWGLNVRSLLHISAKVVLNNKSFYDPNMIPCAIADFLDNVNICFCGRAVLNGFYFSTKELSIYNLCRMVICNNNIEYVRFQFQFCSFKCFLSRLFM